MLAISPRTFHELVRRGDITPVKIPGLRRTVFSVAEIRDLAARWRANGTRGAA